MSDGLPPEDDFIIEVPWSDFSTILTALYEIVDVLQGVLGEYEEEHPLLALVPKKPKEEGH